MVEISIPAMAPAEVVASTWFGGKLRLVNTRRREEYGADALVVQALDGGVLMTLNRNTCEFYVELCLKASAVAELARWLREASE